MPNLFIHIGTHKTGTTAIQDSLAANRFKIKNQGVYYIPPIKAWVDIMRLQNFDRDIVKANSEYFHKITNKYKSKNKG